MRISTFLLFLGCAAMICAPAFAARSDALGGSSSFISNADGSVVVDGVFYGDMMQYQLSDEFKKNGARCGSPDLGQLLAQGVGLDAASDCSFSSTTIRPEFNPQNGPIYTIPVVFHIVSRTDGTGTVSDSLINSQLDIMNEDFRALPGSLGAPGTDTRIQFVFASTDPNGNPTNGINRYTNNAWFTDPGPGAFNDMKDAINWDPTSYFNIYSNDSAGSLGYATFPQQDAGDPEDGIVLLWSSVGRNAPQGGIYNQGRTATHEIGHYLGLFHVFQGGCGSASSPYSTGDLIADTNAQSGQVFNCPGSSNSCGNSNPVENYMNYTQDTCMDRFTAEQANRMRCSVDAFRSSLVSTGPTNTAPTVTISSPSNGTTVQQGTSVSFSGSASDAEDGSLTGSLSWSSNLDGNIGSGGSFSTSGLSVGTHTVTASVTDSGGLSGSDTVSVTISSTPPPSGVIDWNATALTAYSNQDGSGSVTIEDGGATVCLTGNRWRRTTQTYTISSTTRLEFDFRSTSQGEIHGAGFDEDDTLTNAARIFRIYGTQNWGGDINFTPAYTGSGSYESFSIPVGQSYTGSGFRLVLVNDKDAGAATNTGCFRNVRIVDDGPPPGGDCTIEEDFESGAGGWFNSGSSTCSTGSFVVGTPTSIVNSGVTTQLAGDHTTGSGDAFFSAVNTSAGSNDVDGGNCIVESPTYSVTEASDVSAWYFHGQRDAGDDASGDFFRLEISTNGGSTWSTLASRGDQTTNAAWTEATTTVAAGTSVKFRIQVSDGSGPGDLIEAGIDDVSICPQ